MMSALLDIRPIAGALGAEIHGVDLAQPLADDTIAAVRRSLLDHLVIFFPGQSLSPAQLVVFGNRFGPLEGHEFVEGMTDHPEVLELIKEADEAVATGIAVLRENKTVVAGTISVLLVWWLRGPLG